MVTDKGPIIAGDEYSDTLAPGQMDAYDTPIIAGITYHWNVQTSTPLDYAIVDAAGDLVSDGIVTDGGVIDFTPLISSEYTIDFQTYNNTSGTYSFTSDMAGVSSHDGGELAVGGTYSDTLAWHQIDGYRMSVQAGDTYTFTLSPDSVGLNYVMIGTSNDPLEGTLAPGQTVTYTATASGAFGMSVSDSDWGGSGAYSFTLSDSLTGSGGGSVSNTPGPTTTPGNTPGPTTTSSNTPASPPTPTVSGEDMSTGTPLNGYGNGFADNTNDTLSVSITADGASVTTGGGIDFIHASGAGMNLLSDNGGLINFEYGSTAGNNGFFLNADQPVTWNFIANMHSGDFAVIYGIDSQNLSACAQDGLGVPGASGLTLETSNGGSAAYITFAGFSKADLGTKLETAFGTAADGKSFLLAIAT